MIVHVITYNLGMGTGRDSAWLLPKGEAIECAASTVAAIASDGPCILCVQEIQGDQLDLLRAKLDAATVGRKWDMAVGMALTPDKAKLCSAIYSTGDITDQSAWTLAVPPGAFLGLAAKVRLDGSGATAWALTANLSDMEEDVQRSRLVDLLKKMVKYDSHTPIFFCGDLVSDVAPGTSPVPVNEDRYKEVVLRLERFGFTRGDGFVPGREDVTYPSWGGKPYKLVDYVFVNTAGKGTPMATTTVDFAGTAHGETRYASDHKGVHMAFNYPALIPK